MTREKRLFLTRKAEDKYVPSEATALLIQDSIPIWKTFLWSSDYSKFYFGPVPVTHQQYKTLQSLIMEVGLHGK